MASHLAIETNVPEIQQNLAIYYGQGLMPAELGQTAAIPRQDMHPDLARRLKIEPGQALSAEQVTNLLTGLATDGEEIEGKRYHRITAEKSRIAYVDLCFSAPKSFSVALAFAPTEDERAALDLAHRRAVDSTLAYIESQIAVATKGSGGRHGADPAHMGWVQFDHYTARPTVKIGREENGQHVTDLITVKVAGDPQRHTHCIIPNAVVTDEGRVGAIPMQRLKGRIHEYGAIYQGFLSANVQPLGVEVDIDRKTWTLILKSVPHFACDMFSKRSKDGEEAARAYAKTQGFDWDALSPEGKVDLLKGGNKASRRYKGDDLADYSQWQKQAAEGGYQHRSVLRPGEERELEDRLTRSRKAYEISLPYLEQQMERHSKFEGSLARIAAAKGFIVPGIQDPGPEIGAVTRAYRTEGVRQNGEMTSLTWGRSPDHQWASFTTKMHLTQETEAIGLLQKAAADKSTALTPETVERAVRASVAERGYDFTTPAGKQQREMIDRLAAGGRATVGIGIAGSGKTALLDSLVRAWKDDGRDVYGVTLAWRQTKGLSDAGIAIRGKRRNRSTFTPDTRDFEAAGLGEERAVALQAFLRRADKGQIELTPKSVVVVDEIAQIGTHQILHLARLQDQHGFQIVGLGDQMQCTAISAGNSIRLFQKALGEQQVPELLNTIRQITERDRETSLMFRDGNATEALERKDEDGTLMIQSGGYRQAIAAAVDLWEERRWANAAVPDYTVGLSAPTNLDAREIGAEIRRRRQLAGEVGPDKMVLKAIDQAKPTGTTYDLAIAEGDRLRLFDRVHGKFSKGHGCVGVNGTVVEVLAITADGLRVRNPKGHEAEIGWHSLTDKETKRIRLTYGDALTIDARQGDTLTEHITVMPGGSQAVNGFKGYTAESRHRMRSWIVTSQGEELNEIYGRRPLGDPRNAETDHAKIRQAIKDNMARNLSRQDEKVLATDFEEQARGVKHGMVGANQAAWHRPQTEPKLAQAQHGHGSTNMFHVKPDPQPVAPLAKLAGWKLHLNLTPDVSDPLTKAVSEHLTTAGIAHKVGNGGAVAKTAPAQAKKARPVISEAEATVEFSAALDRVGLRVSGPPIMDGKLHRAPVDGDRGKRTSGSYVGYLDAWPAGYIHNFRTGEETRWRAGAPTREMSPQEREERARQQEADRARREQERQEKEEQVAARSERAWRFSKPAPKDHPYLHRKGIRPHGTRVDSRGNLLIPMRDADGKLWNLQRISPDGEKLFGAGRTKGLFAQIGRPKGNDAILETESFSTGATLMESTSLSTVIAFGSGNLVPVAQAIRAKHPDRPIVVASDNDHHLPRRDPPLPNVGVQAARAAAVAVLGQVIIPEFEPHDSGTDYNDVAATRGKEAVRAELEKAGVPMPDPNAPATQQDRDMARKQSPSRPLPQTHRAAQQNRDLRQDRGRGDHP